MTAEEVARLLHSRRAEDRIRALVALRGLADSPDRQALLLKALDDKVNYIAALAAEALGDGADYTGADAMLAKFLCLQEEGPRRDPGCHIRGHLAFGFGRLGYVRASDALRLGIRTVQIEAVGGVPFDTAAHLRANCALALAEIRDRDAVRDIAPLLFDDGRNRAGIGPKSPSVTVETRKVAARALARLGDPAGLVALSIRLTFPGDESADVLQECMLAAVALQDPRLLELLEPYLAHRDLHLAAYAALMLAQAQLPEAAQLIQQMVPRLTGDALRAVVLALTVLRTEDARSVLHALAEDPRMEIRLAVAETLQNAPDAHDRARLEQMAESDPAAPVRSAARQALTG